MLVLSRMNNESIVIGDDIVITVVEIRGDKVRLGVDAPREVPVHRREVYARAITLGNTCFISQTCRFSPRGRGIWGLFWFLDMIPSSGCRGYHNRRLGDALAFRPAEPKNR